MLVNQEFWDILDQLIRESELIIDRPKGSCHPKYPDMRYEVDYGYLQGTASMDGQGIDVWRGSDPGQRLDAIICTVDRAKRDSEIKLLIGCTSEERGIVYQFHNNSDKMKGLLILRDISGNSI